MTMPYLREELARQYYISFDEYSNNILRHGVSLDSTNISQNYAIGSDKRFQTLLSKYPEPVNQDPGD